MSGPQTVDEHTAAMNRWFQQSFDLHMRPHIKDANKAFDAIGEECGKSFDVAFDAINRIVKCLDSGKKDAEGKIILRKFDDQSQTIYELMMVIKHLATNDYSRGAIAQLIKSFKVKHDIKEQMAVVFVDERQTKVRSSSKQISKSLSVDDRTLDQTGYY